MSVATGRLSPNPPVWGWVAGFVCLVWWGCVEGVVGYQAPCVLVVPVMGGGALVGWGLVKRHVVSGDVMALWVS